VSRQKSTIVDPNEQVVISWGGKLHTVTTYPSKSFMKYVCLVESRLVGYEIPRLDHDYERFFRVRKGDVVVDAGAHIGLFARSVVKRAKMVVAVECEPRNMGQLRRNMTGFKNVLYVETALWNRNGKMPLFRGYSPSEHSLISGVEVEGRKRTGKLQTVVETDTLDNVLHSLNIGKVDFLKMDIEGAEIEALEGASETLKKLPKIVVASYHVRDGEKTVRRVAEILASCGFRLYSTTDGLVHGAKNQR